MNSLVTGLARQGAEISPATLAGTCAQAGALLVPLADAITARSRGSWHLHADETTWRVFAPRDGTARRNGGCGCSSARTPAASSWTPPGAGAGAGPPRRHRREDRAAHGDEDGGPRRLVISSDFYAVYESAGQEGRRPGQSLLLGAVCGTRDYAERRCPGGRGCLPWRGSLGCLERTVLHNHRLSRKASTGSGG